MIFDAVIVKKEENNVEQILDSSVAFQTQSPDRMAHGGDFGILHANSRGDARTPRRRRPFCPTRSTRAALESLARSHAA